MSEIATQILERVQVLSPEQQQRVLDFTRSLSGSASAGISGMDLIRFAGAIPLDDLVLMEQAIEEGCERIDAHEW